MNILNKCIYLVDDDLEIRKIFSIIFEKEGYHTCVFESGKDLLENGRKYPDVYILDKQLPGMDGLDICRGLKSNKKTRNIPVIIISATPDIALLAKNAGADDYIRKPLSKKELLNVVAKNLNHAA